MLKCVDSASDGVVFADGLCDEYQIPYFECVANDPSFDEMKKIVCEDGYRPEIPVHYQLDPVSPAHCNVHVMCYTQV